MFRHREPSRLGIRCQQFPRLLLFLNFGTFPLGRVGRGKLLVEGISDVNTRARLGRSPTEQSARVPTYLYGSNTLMARSGPVWIPERRRVSVSKSPHEYRMTLRGMCGYLCSRLVARQEPTRYGRARCIQKGSILPKPMAIHAGYAEGNSWTQTSQTICEP